MRAATLLSLVSCIPFVYTQGSSSGVSSTASTAIAQPTANISPDWLAAISKAKNAVKNLTLSDKVNLGTGHFLEVHIGPCIGNTPAISKIDYPGLCLEDSPLGVRSTDKVSAFPAGINAAATFNRDLIYKRGAAIGAEHKGKGVNVALGPMMNIMRAPAAGRNWEGFGGDPYLSGEAAYETIRGTQSIGVQACAKHFINNEQEHSREQASSNVDDRTQHEIYGLPFLRSVQAGVASFMCSYSKINGTYACENDKMLNGVLKGEFGFPGYVMSDWLATHSTLSVNAGLDMTMPGDIIPVLGGSYFGLALEIAVQLGQVSEERIDDLATRVLAGWYLLGQDSPDYPAVNFNAWIRFLGQEIDVQDGHGSLIREIGGASTVLLKNNGKVLPLHSPSTIAVIGSGAGNSSKGPNGYSDRGGNDGVLAMGWGSGTCDFPYLVAPLDAITGRASADGTTISSSLSDTDTDKAKSVASGKDVAFVFITADSGEAYITVEGNEGDRNDLFAWHEGDALVQAVSSVNNNTIVVVNSVGPIITEAWVTNENVTAIVWAGLPGQEAGNALVDVLYGAVNPSGRLPYTIAKNASDYSAQVIYKDNTEIQIDYSEGIFVDYRHFDQAGIEPRFEFGYGLSYTTFDYSNLKISGSTAGGSRQPNGNGQSLDPWLHEKVINVSFAIKNNGSVDGTEVIPQLYTSPPASAKSAPMNLKGFDNVQLAAGESKTITLQLSRFDLSVWNVETQRYELHEGETGISVGASSRDIRLRGSINV
ncbi:uncharacterized protein FOMMEDRAFT_187156 [Fomitiporia mediterranea MF3/22]|uniref:uncharacterized protein n=1 Tax=Fomitiporia mediterranea (strain MF3/22) TaxID=694068 RepID=UPI0004408E01|nr:uncharacterized protein FOMMEDRAFT_187156 [Fomitiporia mediterranea MF3/22]EJD04021.1 hypothetical protein FOMMEDRAFT_187156 [Fomitiporia mediterranea MF3/22]